MEFQNASLKHPTRRVVQFDGTMEMAQDIAQWVGPKSFGMVPYITAPTEDEDFEPYVTIPTMEGYRSVRKGDWVLEILGDNVDPESAVFRAYRDEDFRKLYDLEGEL